MSGCVAGRALHTALCGARSLRCSSVRRGSATTMTKPDEIEAYYHKFVAERMRMAAASQSAHVQSLLSESDLLWRMANQSLHAPLLGHLKRELVDAADERGALQRQTAFGAGST